MFEAKINYLAANGVDAEKAVARFMGKYEIYEKFLVKFVNDKTFGMLTEAVSGDDKEKIELYSHTLKGSSANLGLIKLNEASARLVNVIRGNEDGDIQSLFDVIQKEHVNITDVIKGLEKVTL